MKKRSQLRILIGLGLFQISLGCTILSSQSIPDWVDGTSKEFPNERYLVGRGEAESRDLAEQRAYAALARIFYAEVDAQSRDTETYSQIARGDHSTMTRRLTLDHRNQVSTKKTLENVEILDAWHRHDTSLHMVLAGLNREKVGRILVERISEHDKAVELNLDYARASDRALEKLRGFKRAIRNLKRREAINNDLKVIRMNGVGIPANHSLTDLQQELTHYLADDVVIAVEVTGEQENQVRKAIWEGLNREGIVPTAHDQTPSNEDPQQRSLPDLLITGTAHLQDLKLFDPLFKYVRWCSDLQVVEQVTQKVVGVVSRSGKEGHITFSEARARASKAMQATVTSEVAHTMASYLYDDPQHTSISSSFSCSN